MHYKIKVIQWFDKSIKRQIDNCNAIVIQNTVGTAYYEHSLIMNQANNYILIGHSIYITKLA